MKLIIDIPKANYEKMKIMDEKGAFENPYLMAIAQGTPLKQEPFINKPCISEKVCKHDKQMVLDKIRAEFISLYPRNYAGELELGGISCVFSLNEVLSIIDKYKAENVLL